MVVDERTWPYLFCAHCEKLTPIKEDPITLKSECMVCNYTILTSKAGRTVFLSVKEARVRSLPVVKRG
ncbi:MAG: hypothetical protein KOO63_08020 [Bacteroidales bacterium]|nr:hypothetical protein [Candidatus Latescibacterota bacterium]